MKGIEDIREGYAGGWTEESIPGKNARREFDEWLAAHDAALSRTSLLTCMHGDATLHV